MKSNVQNTSCLLIWVEMMLERFLLNHSNHGSLKSLFFVFARKGVTSLFFVSCIYKTGLGDIDSKCRSQNLVL